MFAQSAEPAESTEPAEPVAPAAVPAGPLWYGKLHGGIMLDKGKDAKFYDGGSRIGIKGSNEISEGLSAVYNFEHAISTEDAGLNSGGVTGRLAYVGLSGGFGSLTLGQLNSASYTHAGAIRDIGNWYSSGDTGSRIGNALSYSFVGDAFSVQFDAIMDGKKDTGKAVDQWELGATVNIGDIGKVAFAHVKKEDAKTGNKVIRVTKWSDGTRWWYSPKLWKAPTTSRINTAGTSANQWKEEYGEGTEMRISIKPITVYIIKTDTTNYDKDARIPLKDSVAGDDDQYGRIPFGTAGAGKLSELSDLGDGSFLYGDKASTCTVAPSPKPATKPAAATDNCAKTTAYKAVLKKNEIEDETFYFAPGHVEDEMDYGEKSSHVSASFDLGAVTLGLGHSTTKSMDPMKTKKAKTNYIGVNGAIGDTGLDWRVWYRTKEAYDADSMMMVKSKPWTIGLGKSLGGGASAYIEHNNNGKNGKDKSSGTVIGMVVAF